MMFLMSLHEHQLCHSRKVLLMNVKLSSSPKSPVTNSENVSFHQLALIQRLGTPTSMLQKSLPLGPRKHHSSIDLLVCFFQKKRKTAMSQY